MARHRHSDPIEGARSELQSLRNATDWNESTPVVHVNVQQAAAARRSSPPPLPAPLPAPRSMAAPREGVIVLVLRIAREGVNRMPPLGVVLIFAMLIAAWVVLAIHGKAPIP